MDVYPPEFDGPDYCEMCGEDLRGRSSACKCPECPECGAVGDPDCQGTHMPFAHNSVHSFCEHVGIAPISQALRAIDKYNTEHVWIVLMDGRRLYYHDREKLDAVPNSALLRAVGVGGIAWDNSDWEWGEECPAGHGWSGLDALRKDFHDALAVWEAMTEEDFAAKNA